MKQWPIEFHAKLASTNDYILAKINSEEVPSPYIVVAEQQDAGKGQYGKSWVSPAGNLYMSIYKVYYDNLSNLKDLSVKVAQSIVAVLQRYSMEELTVKWPNDILYKNQKLCGILIETRQRRQQQIDTVIGIGLNLIDMQPYAQQISQPCIGLTEIITDQDIYDTLAANHYSLLIHEITSEIVKDN